jgi:hypothetical protein
VVARQGACGSTILQALRRKKIKTESYSRYLQINADIASENYRALLTPVMGVEKV